MIRAIVDACFLRRFLDPFGRTRCVRGPLVSRSRGRRLALALPCAGCVLACGTPQASPGSSAAGPQPVPAPAQASAEAGPADTQWDFSVTSKWRLCEPGDLDDCTLQ
jgi:hypothetical protein